MSQPLVILDPGHGGDDPGAKSALINPPDAAAIAAWAALPRVWEKDFTLCQCLVAESFVRRAGFRTELTRRTDQTVRNRIRAQLANRAQANVFISVHWNSAGRAEPDGTIVLHHRDSEQGSELARILFAKVRHLDGEVERWERTIAVPEPGYRGGDFVPTVIGETRMPAVLLEVEFASNPREALRMLSTPYQLAVGQAIAESLEEWWTG